MEFLQGNCFWILLVALFIWMRASGRECCGHPQHRPTILKKARVMGINWRGQLTGPQVFGRR